MFDHQAVFQFKGEDEDAVLEALMMADVDVTDIENEDGMITIFAPHTEYSNAKQALAAAFGEIDYEVDAIQFLAQTTTEISEEDQPMFERFIDLLNDLDDVQNIYHNVD